MSKQKTNILYIGYWNNNNNQYPQFPLPIARSEFDNSNDLKILDFVIAKSSTRFTKGFSMCRLCNCSVGSEEHNFSLKDKTLVIPEGYSHYIKEHFIDLDQNIIDAYNITHR